MEGPEKKPNEQMRKGGIRIMKDEGGDKREKGEEGDVEKRRAE